MIKIELIINKNIEISLFPKDTITEIIQNISVILATEKGSVSLNPNLGLDRTFVDMPSEKGMLLMRLNLIECIHEFEPRVEVASIDFEDEGEGVFVPYVKVVIKDE